MNTSETTNRPLISIIVVAYNAEETLARSINSIVGQTLLDFELIIVNDGSTDGTQTIIDQYAETDDRIKTESQPNSGVSVARQIGLNLASGLYTIFVDADDWIEKDMMELLYNKAIQESADIVFCDYIEERGAKSLYRKQKPKSDDSKIVLEQMFEGLYGTLWNKLIVSSLYKKSGASFVKGLNFCEDECVIIRLLNFGCKVGYVDHALYHYDKTVNAGSYTNMWYTRPVEEYELFIKSCAPYLNTPKMKQNFDNRIASIIKKLTYAPSECYPECRKFYLRHRESLWSSKMSLSRKVYCWLFYHGFRRIKRFGNVNIEECK